MLTHTRARDRPRRERRDKDRLAGSKRVSDKEDQRLRGPTPLALHGANAICTQAEPTDRPTTNERPTDQPTDPMIDRRTDGLRRPLVCSTPSLLKPHGSAPHCFLPPSFRFDSLLPCYSLSVAPLYITTRRGTVARYVYMYIYVTHS